MRLEFHPLNNQNLLGASKLLYKSFRQNEWLEEGYLEKEIIQSIIKSLQDPIAQNFSTVVIDTDRNNEILGVHLALPLVHYINQLENWEFHKHFSQIEEYFSHIQSNFGGHHINQIVWSYWVTNKLTTQKVPKQLNEILSEKIKQIPYSPFVAIVSLVSHVQTRVIDFYASQKLDPITFQELPNRESLDRLMAKGPKCNVKEYKKPQSDNDLTKYLITNISMQNNYFDEDNEQENQQQENVFEKVLNQWKEASQAKINLIQPKL